MAAAGTATTSGDTVTEPLTGVAIRAWDTFACDSARAGLACVCTDDIPATVFAAGDGVGSAQACGAEMVCGAEAVCGADATCATECGALGRTVAGVRTFSCADRSWRTFACTGDRARLGCSKRVSVKVCACAFGSVAADFGVAVDAVATVAVAVGGAAAAVAVAVAVRGAAAAVAVFGARVAAAMIGAAIVTVAALRCTDAAGMGPIGTVPIATGDA
jgi:hypothetical protein